MEGVDRSSSWLDIRFSIRTTVNSPSFAILGIATLALGIGAGTATFSLVHGFMLRPLPGGKDSGPQAAGIAVKFSVPAVANGKVYLGTQAELNVSACCRTEGGSPFKALVVRNSQNASGKWSRCESAALTTELRAPR
jgi:hypothetical protein